jgi:hypothetical protein
MVVSSSQPHADLSLSLCMKPNAGRQARPEAGAQRTL